MQEFVLFLLKIVYFIANSLSRARNFSCEGIPLSIFQQFYADCLCSFPAILCRSFTFFLHFSLKFLHISNIITTFAPNFLHTNIRDT